VPRFAVLPVAGALGLHDVRWHSQCDFPVGDAVASGAFRIAVLDAYFVSEEPRRLAAGVGNQGFLLVQFQPEGFPEEVRQFFLDFLGFGLRPDESQQLVVGIPDIA
jgi:hypothetical protein